MERVNLISTPHTSLHVLCTRIYIHSTYTKLSNSSQVEHARAGAVINIMRPPLFYAGFPKSSELNFTA